jgi:cytoskeleton protein RodZ
MPTQTAVQHPPKIAAPVPSVPISQTPPPPVQASTQPTPTTSLPPAATAAPVATPAAQSPTQVLAALPRGQVYGQYNANSRVVLRARMETKVLVQDSSGKVFINRTLQPGDSYEVPDMVGLTLSTPDGGAVGIELDGQAMGFAGPVGKLTEALSLNPQSISDKFSGQSPG